MKTRDLAMEPTQTQRWIARFGWLVTGVCLLLAGIGLVGFGLVLFQILDTFGQLDATALNAEALSLRWILFATGVLGAIGSAWIAVHAVSVRGQGPHFADFGTLILHAENDVRREVKHSARWAAVVLVALALIGVAVVRFVVSGNTHDGPSWWIAAVFLPSVLCLVWGFIQFWSLLGRWWRVGWSVDVFEEGLVESRFGAVRSAMPFRGGTLDRRGFVFTSPSPLYGFGRFTLVHHEGEQASDVYNAVRMTAARVLVRDSLMSLEAGSEIVFPSTRHVLTGRGLRLPDGRECVYTSLEVRLWQNVDGSRERTKIPDHSDKVEVLCGQESVLTVGQYDPNAIVFREVLLVMTNPKYREGMSSLYAP